MPVLSSWVRALVTVTYRDPFGVIPPTPVPESGFTPTFHLAGQVTNATVETEPRFGWSNEPSWSPTGTRLVLTENLLTKTPQFNSQIGTVVWTAESFSLLGVVNADGTGLTAIQPPLPARMAGGDWSPVEDRIASAILALVIPADILTGIVAVNPDGTSLIYRLPFNAFDPRFVMKVRWSPDGRRLAFTARSRPPLVLVNTDALFVVNADGTNPIQLHQNGSGQTIEGFDWAPDGRRIAFDVITNTLQSVLPGDFPIPVPTAGDIFTVAADGTEPPTRLTSDGRSFGPAWRMIP